MKLLVIGSNGNFSIQLQNTAKNYISHIVNQDVYAGWDKKTSRLKTEIIKASRELKFCYIVNCVGVISKKHTKDYSMHWNFLFPKYLHQIAKELNLALVTLGSIQENFPEICFGNSYLESKLKLQQYLAKEDSASYCHLQFHTWYGGSKVHPEMFLGQIIASIKFNKEFNISDGNQIREYHHIADDAECVLNFLNKCGLGTHHISHGQRYTLSLIATSIFKFFNCEHLLKISHIPSSISDLRAPLNFPDGITKYSFRPTMEGLFDYIAKNI